MEPSKRYLRRGATANGVIYQTPCKIACETLARRLPSETAFDYHEATIGEASFSGLLLAHVPSDRWSSGWTPVAT